uniref:Xylulose kinase n=1 Tax=Nicotiana sylvestris TaxID=4096 RepID=A0A1U7XUH0_NICSY|nr:PREDICTED: xylulose kinase-like isoform X4 [Nicotiana sylvestris]
MEDCSLPQDSLFLGFDCSTQSLKATLLDANLNIVVSELVNYDSELPHYNTKGGAFRDPFVNGRIVSPTLMWVEALDLILHRLEKSNVDFGKIAAVSGSAQQHGSVYWKNGSFNILSSLDPKKVLVDQFHDAFSIKESPIWMDCSTTEQCKAIEEAVGGGLELAKLTGSRAHERYVGPQIRKIFETRPEIYQNTERISLVSSFMASLLIGGYACIDQTDGAGMNLMDIEHRTWSKIALEATAPGLEEKLGELAPAYAVAGSIASYYVERYHFNKNCVVVQWSGDNPNSLAGLTLNAYGDLAISLGTSDTVFGIATDHRPSLDGHVFPNPVDTKGFMVMLVYKNGSLTREDGSWETFNMFLQQTPPLNVGFHRYILDNFIGDSADGVVEREIEEFDPPSEVRALIEGQLLSMRAHAERLGMPSPPKRIIATGGTSANDHILRIIASIFGCNVYTVQKPDSASLGAALRAAHGWLCNKKGKFVPISNMYFGKLEKTSLSCKLAMPAGDQNLVDRYTLLMKKRWEIENRLIQRWGRW